MIILPPPWEGIHPAFPRRPEPFSTTSLTNAPVIGGTLGLITAVGTAVLRRNPATALRVAAYSTLASAVLGVAQDQVIGHVLAKPYLQSKGIAVPRQKIVERLFNIDEDTLIVAGGLAGVLVARSVAQPWSITGWRRALGAFSIGAFAGDLAAYGYHYNQIWPCAEKVKQQKVLQAMYAQELSEFRRSKAQELDAVKEAVRVAGAAGQSGQGGQQHPGMTSLQKMLQDMHAGAMKEAQQQQSTHDYHGDGAAAPGPDLDEEDPQPHYSEVRDGERIFRPDTNYKWDANGKDMVSELQKHIEVLRERRSRLAAEAELLWHTLAKREAEYYQTPRSSPAKDERRIALEVMNHLHINTYLEISQLDWCIADSKKNILQAEALRDKKRAWIPEAPANAATVRPKHILQLLSELERDNNMGIEELEMLKASTELAVHDQGTFVDLVTGQKVKPDKETAEKDLKEVERHIDEFKIMKDAIQELREELEAGGKD